MPPASYAPHTPLRRRTPKPRHTLKARILSRAVPKDLVDIWQGQQSTDPEWCLLIEISRTSGANHKSSRNQGCFTRPWPACRRDKAVAKPRIVCRPELTSPATTWETMLAILKPCNQCMITVAQIEEEHNRPGEPSLSQSPGRSLFDLSAAQLFSCKPGSHSLIWGQAADC